MAIETVEHPKTEPTNGAIPIDDGYDQVVAEQAEMEKAEVAETPKPVGLKTAKPKKEAKVKPVAPRPEAPEQDPHEPAGEPDVEPEGETQETPAEPQSWLDDAARSTARDAGFTPDEAMAFGSKDAFDRAVLALNRRLADLGRNTMRPQQPIPQQQPVVQQPQYQPPQPQVQQPVAPRFDLKLGDGYDPELVSAFKGMNDHYAAQMQQLQQQLQAANQQKFIEQAQQFEAEFDEFVGSLGSEWKDVYGEGPSSDLDPNSAAYQKRLTVAQQIAAIEQGRAASGMKRMSRREIAKNAHRIVNSDRIESQARQKIANQLDDRQKAITIPPRQSAGNTPRLTPEQRAILNLRKLREARGLRGPAQIDESDLL